MSASLWAIPDGTFCGPSHSCHVLLRFFPRLLQFGMQLRPACNYEVIENLWKPEEIAGQDMEATGSHVKKLKKPDETVAKPFGNQRKPLQKQRKPQETTIGQKETTRKPAETIVSSEETSNPPIGIYKN